MTDKQLRTPGQCKDCPNYTRLSKLHGSCYYLATVGYSNTHVNATDTCCKHAPTYLRNDPQRFRIRGLL